MSIFAQARLNLLISLGGSSSNVSGSSMGSTITGSVATSGGGTSTYFPIEAGLAF
jgi:hypothetical protein